MEINAIDARENTGWVMSWLWLSHEIHISSVDSLLAQVRAEAGGGRIDALHIWDHGTSNSFQVGDDWIDHGSIRDFREQFVELGSLVSPGFIVLNNCLVGQKEGLCKRFAKVTGCTVYASPKLGTLIPGRRADLDPTRWNPMLKRYGTVDLVSLFDTPLWHRFDPDGTITRKVQVPTIHRMTWRAREIDGVHRPPI